MWRMACETGSAAFKPQVGEPLHLLLPVLPLSGSLSTSARMFQNKLAGRHGAGPGLRGAGRRAAVPPAAHHRPRHRGHAPRQPAAQPRAVPLPQEHQTLPLRPHTLLRDERDRPVPAIHAVRLLRLRSGKLSFFHLLLYSYILDFGCSKEATSDISVDSVEPVTRQSQKSPVSQKNKLTLFV